METGKPGLASAPVHISSVTAQMEKSMDTQAPLTAVYIHTVPSLPAQPYPQAPAATQETATLHLAMPPLYSKETLPFLTLHIAGGLQSQPGLCLAASAPAARPKSAGKHVCPHCGRDCMKPSVLEKHLRCHTGERPYPCVTCGVSFKTQSNLYKHKRTQAHARLSSESGLSSLDSMSSSRETSASSLSLDDSGSVEKDATLPGTEIACPASTVKTHATVSEQNALTPAGQETEASTKVTTEGEKQRVESAKPPVSASRHLPLQRQEATLFSKQWESSVSRGKSQSHESTDSGFSESSDHYPSPGSVLPDHSMDSLTESTKEHLEETTNMQTPSGPGQSGQEPKCTAKEQKTLEERISKLISENTAVVEDKQLEHVRPRKTVLSKQGSIDLPMPYTYKDSFHFDMKISKTPNVGLQRIRKPDFYSSVPTQRSNTIEHAPLTRSNSLPFSVTLLQPEGSSPTSSYQNDYVTLVRRGSSGQINPSSFAMKPVNQHFSTHHPLVRQTAVDGNHATDGLLTNSSAEEACTGGLSCDGDGGDICGEPSNRKFRRKKTQKFAYNKWYMYGGGTFKKLYSAEKGGDDAKGRKCLTNPEHEISQGLRRKSSVTTTGSPINYTSSSSATMCPTGCLPAKLSLNSAVDLNLKTSSSLKTPLRRNLSLSMLPLSSIGSLVSHQTDSMSGAEAGRMIDEEKHTASTSQLCGTHIPSDRKKLKTDDKIICPSEMETDPNTPAHPLPSVTGSAPQQDTNHSYINLQNNLTQLNASFPTSIINTKTLPVSCSSVSSTPSVTKASFLPKYQLKLPNAAEPESTCLLHVMDKQSSHSEKTSPLARTSEKKCDGLFTAPTTICLVETSRLDSNAASTPAVLHRQFAATIVTTTSRNEQAGLCSTSTQPLKSAGGLAPVQSPRLVAPVVTHFPAAPTTTTANNQITDAAVITAFSQPYPKSTPSPSHMVTDQLNPVNTPVVPCHIAPFDQPDAHNVFHVHTADLQICLQIISDEQLALIEPQIERHMGSGLSQRCDAEAVVLEVIQNKAQSSVTMQSSNNGGDYQQELDQSESSPTLPLPAQFGKTEPNVHLTEHSTQTKVTAESTPPEVQGSSLRPHKYGHVNTVTMTQSSADDVMSTVASLKGVKSGWSQASEEEHALFLNRCAKEQLLPDMRISRGGLITQTNSIQHKVRITSLSPSTVDQKDTRSEESKLKDQATPCYAGMIKAIGGDLSDSSFNKCKASRQLNTHCNNPAESTLSVALDPSKHANMGCDTVASSPISASSQEVTWSEMKDVISSTFSEKQRPQFISMSSNILAERPQNISAVLTHIQSPTAGESGGMKMDEVPRCLDKAESNCTYMCSPETKPEQGEDRTMKVDSFQSSRLSEQLLQHPSQTHSLNPQSPQSAPSKSNNLQSGCSQSSLFSSPQSEMNNIYFSQQQWESSSSSFHSQRRQISHQSDSSPCIKAQDKSTGIQSSPQQMQTQTITPAQRGHSAAKLPIGSTSSDANTPPSTQPSQVSHSVQVSRAAAGSTAETKVLDNNTALSFTYTEPGDYHDKAANDYSKYQSFQSECLTSGVRPVQSCQDYTEDTSSSDDEGKLIIEL